MYRSLGPALAFELGHEGPGGRRIAGPDVAIIGAARTGTSWLARAIARHPHAFILAGEPHYFSCHAERSPRAYVTGFASPTARYLARGGEPWSQAPDQVWLGEKSPTYISMSDARIELCAALFPRMKLICLVRNPVQRAWSVIKQLGLADRADDLAFLESAGAPIRLQQILVDGRYASSLARWAKYFPAHQILLIDHGRIAVDPLGVYNEAVEWLGLPARKPLRKLLASFEHTDPPPPGLRRHLQASYAGEPVGIDELRVILNAAHQGSATFGRERLSPEPSGPGHSRGSPHALAGAVQLDLNGHSGEVLR